MPSPKHHKAQTYLHTNTHIIRITLDDWQQNTNTNIGIVHEKSDLWISEIEGNWNRIEWISKKS